MTTPVTTTHAHTTYIGTDPTLGLELMLTVWHDGTHHLATREANSGATWSPPMVLTHWADTATDGPAPAPNDWAAGWGK